jgi:hypothetical protein
MLERKPAIQLTSPASASPTSRVNCRDRLQVVRQELGLPNLDPNAAPPGKPLLIKAVDHRIDGCSVMVMHFNTGDIRALPEATEKPQLTPAR